MAETVPGGLYLQNEQLVDAEGKPIEADNLKGVHGRFLVGVPEEMHGKLKLTAEQKEQREAEIERREREAELEQQPNQLAQLGQLLERANRAMPATSQQPTGASVKTGASAKEIGDAVEKGSK